MASGSNLKHLPVNSGPLKVDFRPLDMDFWPLIVDFGLWESLLSVIHLRPLGVQFFLFEVDLDL